MILTKYLLAVSVELLKTFITVTSLRRSGQRAVHHQECIFRKRFGKFHQYHLLFLHTSIACSYVLSSRRVDGFV